MTRIQEKRLKAKTNREILTKRPTWIEFNPETGLIKNIGRRETPAPKNAIVGKVNKKVAKQNATF